MSRNHTAILGFFVIIGFITLSLTVIAFSPWFTVDYTKDYVVYFQGPLTGLHVGSFVTLRGIKVGQVSGLDLQYDYEKKQFNVPVHINFLKKRSGELADHALIRELIKSGLRAELHVENLLTGSAVIEIKFLPKSKGYVVDQKDSKFLQIPSIPEAEQRADLGVAIDAAKGMFDSINELTNSPKITKLLESITTAGNRTRVLVDTIYDHFPVVSNSITDGFQELKSSAYSIRVLSEYFARHPESLIRGKSTSTGR